MNRTRLVVGLGSVAAVAAMPLALAPAANAAPPPPSAGTSAAPAVSHSLPRSLRHLHLRAGTLLFARPLTGAPALPSAARNYLIYYLSSGPNGHPRIISGTVAIPRGRPPAGGWPVMSWAHGTSGIAQICAPSRDTATGPDHAYLGLMDLTLDQWVAHGFVVVQTDYQGLGNPGPAPYLIGNSEAYNVIDIVQAARHLDHRVGRDWVTIGHSQGGQATLFTEEIAARRAPNLHFLGAVAIAPGYGFPGVSALGLTQDSGTAGPFVPLAIQGAVAVDPAIRPDQFLTTFGQTFYHLAQTTACIDQLRTFVAVNPLGPTRMVFKPGAATNPGVVAMGQILQANVAANVHLTTPTLVVQSTGDTTVNPGTTTALVKTLRANAPGVSLQYYLFPGGDHRASVAASFDHVYQWVQERLAGITPPPD